MLSSRDLLKLKQSSTFLMRIRPFSTTAAAPPAAATPAPPATPSARPSRAPCSSAHVHQHLDVARALNSLARKRGHTAADRESWRVSLLRSLSQAHRSSARETALVLNACRRCPLVADEEGGDLVRSVAEAYTRRARQIVPSFNALGLTVVCKAWSQLRPLLTGLEGGLVDDDLLLRVSERLQTQLQRITPLTLGNLLNALARLDFRDKALLTSPPMQEAVRRCLPSLKALDLVQVINAFARLEWRDVPLLHLLADRCVDQVEYMDCGGLSLVANGYGRLEVRHERLFGRMADRLASCGHSCGLRDVAMIQHAFAKFDFPFTPSVFEATCSLLPACLSSAPSASPPSPSDQQHSLTLILTAAAKVGFRDLSAIAPLMQVLFDGSASAPLLHSLTPGQLAMLTSAMGQLAQSDERLVVGQLAEGDDERVYREWRGWWGQLLQQLEQQLQGRALIVTAAAGTEEASGPHRQTAATIPPHQTGPAAIVDLDELPDGQEDSDSDDTHKNDEWVDGRETAEGKGDGWGEMELSTVCRALAAVKCRHMPIFDAVAQLIQAPESVRGWSAWSLLTVLRAFATLKHHHDGLLRRLDSAVDDVSWELDLSAACEWASLRWALTGQHHDGLLATVEHLIQRHRHRNTARQPARQQQPPPSSAPHVPPRDPERWTVAASRPSGLQTPLVDLLACLAVPGGPRCIEQSDDAASAAALRWYRVMPCTSEGVGGFDVSTVGVLEKGLSAHCRRYGEMAERLGGALSAEIGAVIDAQTLPTGLLAKLDGLQRLLDLTWPQVAAAVRPQIESALQIRTTSTKDKQPQPTEAPPPQPRMAARLPSSTMRSRGPFSTTRRRLAPPQQTSTADRGRRQDTPPSLCLKGGHAAADDGGGSSEVCWSLSAGQAARQLMRRRMATDQGGGSDGVWGVGHPVMVPRQVLEAWCECGDDGDAAGDGGRYTEDDRARPLGKALVDVSRRIVSHEGLGSGMVALVLLPTMADFGATGVLGGGGGGVSMATDWCAYRRELAAVLRVREWAHGDDSGVGGAGVPVPVCVSVRDSTTE
ncbi:unnamed protein product [Vitrella brassicaformis CCMP3155]|uniref:RNA-editing substrate-binding complex 6 protein domain-containing protein n=2 Tax=Vitrella brassicaformis TaxID=1169539 RepID=A0A0G4H452_VITBC|nr:unnamed protein product [Vitrella brassicaformis CCMP3155]|eukprot:CEM38532.1 unnamed protein product [Vitrella brassicaformis CCMP3155]